MMSEEKRLSVVLVLKEIAKENTNNPTQEQAPFEDSLIHGQKVLCCHFAFSVLIVYEGIAFMAAQCCCQKVRGTTSSLKHQEYLICDPRFTPE